MPRSDFHVREQRNRFNCFLCCDDGIGIVRKVDVERSVHLPVKASSQRLAMLPATIVLLNVRRGLFDDGCNLLRPGSIDRVAGA